MAKVNKDRDLKMAEAGLVRAAVIAKLFAVQTSTVIKWPKPGADLGSYKASGLHWFNWEEVRKSRQVEADVRNLPSTASAVLQFSYSI